MYHLFFIRAFEAKRKRKFFLSLIISRDQSMSRFSHDYNNKSRISSKKQKRVKYCLFLLIVLVVLEELAQSLALFQLVVFSFCLLLAALSIIVVILNGKVSIYSSICLLILQVSKRKRKKNIDKSP